MRISDWSSDVCSSDLHLELLDVDRGEDVVAHDALGDQDGVLEVVALPRHEGDQHVAAERQLAQAGRGAVGDDLAGRHLVAHLHQRALVDAGRSEEHTYELQSLMRSSYAVFCLKKKNTTN